MGPISSITSNSPRFSGVQIVRESRPLDRRTTEDVITEIKLVPSFFRKGTITSPHTIKPNEIKYLGKRPIYGTEGSNELVGQWSDRIADPKNRDTFTRLDIFPEVKQQLRADLLSVITRMQGYATDVLEGPKALSDQTNIQFEELYKLVREGEIKVDMVTDTHPKLVDEEFPVIRIINPSPKAITIVEK